MIGFPQGCWKLISRRLDLTWLLPCLCVLVLVAPVSAASVSAENEHDYRVGQGDILKITVYDHPDLSTTARVDGEGKIMFPLAGQLDIDGMTAQQIAAYVAKALSGDYVINPQVSVFIEEFRSKKVVVVGRVVKPGLYELAGPTTLFELISKAGGLKDDAGLDVTIHREPSPDFPEGEILTVNLKALLEDSVSAVDIPLRDGDSVTVPLAGVVYVTGQVKRPAAYRLEFDTSVIKVITKAGGFTELAAQSKVKIIRKIDGQEHEMANVSMYELLKPDDVVIVPESFF